jgi:hypothetical protein
MAKLLQSTLFQSKGELMIKAKKNRAVSVLTVLALVIAMLPMGALVATASTSSAGTSYSATETDVVRGVGSSSQLAGVITMREPSSDDEAWSEVDTQVDIATPSNVKFAGKPTVKLNGTALSVTMDSSATVHVDVAGTDGTRDTLEISNIKLYVGSVSTSVTDILMSVDDPADNTDVLSVDVADILDGFVVAVTDKNKAVDIGENNQAVSSVTLTESTSDTVDADDEISITCPSGVTFYEPPSLSVSASSGTAMTFDSNTGSLSSDRKTATWVVNTPNATGIDTLTLGSMKINIDSTVASGTDIEFTFACDNSDVAVAPSPSKVAEASSGDDITITADTAPTISKTVNQQVGDITIQESSDGLITEETLTATLDTTGCAFASTPKATPSGGIELEDSSGSGVTTAVSGTMDDTTLASTHWIVASESTDENGGKIAISGLVINVSSDAPTGAVRLTLSGAAGTKTITIAYISATANIEVTASGTPAIKINTAGQAAGDITITETKSGALAAGDISLRIFGVTTDNEVAFSEAPTISVVSGDVDVATTGTMSKTTGEDDTFTFDVNTASGTKSVLKLSGISYDVNAKAVEGSVQVVVMNGTTRLATVSNATISKTGQTFSDVASNHWASIFINYLATKGIINGYTDGTFKPEGVITRAEFAKIAVMAGNFALSTTSTTSSFSDVASSHWAFKYIETAKNQGIIGGYADGTFRPDEKISRAELAKMVVTAGKFTINNTGTAFPDVASDHWAYDYVMTAKNLGIIGGYPDGTFKPSGNATRAEASKMVYEWLN